MLCALNDFYSPAQCTRWLASVGNRYSCRRYGAGPDVAQRSALVYSMQRLCLPGVRMELCRTNDKKVFFGVPPLVRGITGTDAYAALIGHMGEGQYMLHAGISGEALVLEATSLGLGTCWVSGTYHRKNVDVHPDEDERLLALIALGVPEKVEQPRHQRKPLPAVCTGDPSHWPLWAYNAAECVRFAPSPLNLQPWRMSFAGATLQLSGGREPSLWQGIAMLHLEIACAGYAHTFTHAEPPDICTLVVEE